VLDISMPGKNGIDVLKSVRERYPKMQVIILSMFPEDQYAVRALKNGAAGYVSKEAAPENLVEAIRQASRGKKYVTPAVALALAERIDDKSGAERPLHETLSDREYETLRLIANGKKLSEIAEILALSPKTVSVYRARLLEKMKLRNNADIARYAAKLGLIE
jgi:DNA-binding NarL/FixJ family response regulator